MKALRIPSGKDTYHNKDHYRHYLKTIVRNLAGTNCFFEIQRWYLTRFKTPSNPCFFSVHEVLIVFTV
jgi:hypothetical protein